ncbi:hypothetical protein MPDQ_006212 [Monascus purpureus]|uniref:Uncharacterized protein n=1 Tax=Monascus purpureus TaxID=5098 RepID=A0A507QUZ7_MONPU|nr:hypothetical protein MPDQ_006212 [Monascus purpureus]
MPSGQEESYCPARRAATSDKAAVIVLDSDKCQSRQEFQKNSLYAENLATHAHKLRADEPILLVSMTKQFMVPQDNSRQRQRGRRDDRQTIMGALGTPRKSNFAWGLLTANATPHE